jgi:hypothetical protein
VIYYSLLAISPLCDIILRTFRFLTPKQFNCFSPNFRLGARVPDDGYSRKTSLWITFYIKLYVLSLIQIYTFCHWYRFIRFVIDTDLYVLSLIQTYTFCHWYRLIRFVIDTDLYVLSLMQTHIFHSIDDTINWIGNQAICIHSLLELKLRTRTKQNIYHIPALWNCISNDQRYILNTKSTITRSLMLCLM